MKAVVTNPEYLLYGQEVDVIAQPTIYIDQDNEQYRKEDLQFIDED